MELRIPLPPLVSPVTPTLDKSSIQHLKNQQTPYQLLVAVSKNCVEWNQMGMEIQVTPLPSRHILQVASVLYREKLT